MDEHSESNLSPPPKLPTREQVVEALKPLARYFRPTWAPAFKEGGIFITIDGGYGVDPEIRDAGDRIEAACKALGMRQIGSRRHPGQRTYNPAYPEVAFMDVVKQVLGLSDEAKTVLLMPNAPRYVQIHGEENLRKLADAGIEFPGYKNHLPAAQTLDEDKGGGMTRLGGRISDPRTPLKANWSDKL